MPPEVAPGLFPRYRFQVAPLFAPETETLIVAAASTVIDAPVGSANDRVSGAGVGEGVGLVVGVVVGDGEARD